MRCSSIISADVLWAPQRTAYLWPPSPPCPKENNPKGRYTIHWQIWNWPRQKKQKSPCPHLRWPLLGRHLIKLVEHPLWRAVTFFLYIFLSSSWNHFNCAPAQRHTYRLCGQDHVWRWHHFSCVRWLVIVCCALLLSVGNWTIAMFGDFPLFVGEIWSVGMDGVLLAVSCRWTMGKYFNDLWDLGIVIVLSLLFTDLTLLSEHGKNGGGNSLKLITLVVHLIVSSLVCSTTTFSYPRQAWQVVSFRLFATAPLDSQPATECISPRRNWLGYILWPSRRWKLGKSNCEQLISDYFAIHLTILLANILFQATTLYSFH